MKLRFNDLDELCSHLNRIESHNHRPLRKWSAAQNFFHLAGAFEGSIEGLPTGFPFFLRKVVRPFRWILTRFRMPPLVPIPAAIRFKLEPSDDADFIEQKERLFTAIEAFRSFDGELSPHPVIGKLTRDEWTGFHLRHCERHLSFISLSVADNDSESRFT